MEDYRTVRGTATGEYEEKKSRFIAQLSFADSEEAAVAFLEQVRAANRTARHNVYAYRLRAGNRERYSDDGEPAKTAGTPALEVLQHSGLTDLIVVVTRYFGGVLLGTGGLVRAYTTATARALENAEVVTVRSVVELSVTVDYSLYERASLLIDAAGAKQAAPQFTDRVTLCWQMPEHTEGPLLEQLRELTRGSALSSAGELAAATLGGSGSLTAFERACDDALVRYLQRARRTPFGPEVIVGYLSAKEVEFTAVRTILSGKLAGLDAEDIRARLRLSYL